MDSSPHQSDGQNRSCVATDLIATDYLDLARHLERQASAATPSSVHPALAAQLPAAVATLRNMASDPAREANQRAYHTLKLFVP